jgi:2,3-bisphosphoglycerate-independent phosphoglycerate mutase
LQKKIRAIEDFDSRVVQPVLAAVGPAVNVAVLPDHPVPVALGKHTRKPVPVAVRMAGRAPDSVTVFDEVACLQGSLGSMKNGDLMNLLFRSCSGCLARS